MGSVEAGEVGSPTQDIAQAPESSAQAHESVVSESSAPQAGRPARIAGSEAARALRVLRDYRKLAGHQQLLAGDETYVAQVARPQRPAEAGPMGQVCADSATIPPSTSAHRPSAASSCSESVDRGAGCVNRARPDLWDPWEGNFPGAPDQNWIVANLTLLRGSSGSEVRRAFDAARGDRDLGGWPLASRR